MNKIYVTEAVEEVKQLKEELGKYGSATDVKMKVKYDKLLRSETMNVETTEF